MMRGALFLCLVLLPVRRFAVLSQLGGNTAHAVNCQVFLPPFYPRAVHVISCTRLSPVLVYYGFKGRSLYARRESLGTRLATKYTHTHWVLLCERIYLLGPDSAVSSLLAFISREYATACTSHLTCRASACSTNEASSSSELVSLISPSFTSGILPPFLTQQA